MVPGFNTKNSNVTSCMPYGVIYAVFMVGVDTIILALACPQWLHTTYVAQVSSQNEAS